MKYVSTKTWPWPVLRDGSTDYERCEFQVEIEADLREGSTEVALTADFDLSDPALLSEIEAGRARYALLIVCTTTHFRTQVYGLVSQIKWTAKDGLLADRVEVTPFVVATEEMSEFASRNWNADYNGRKYSLLPGSVLAVEPPSAFWIQPSDETPATTVFRTEGDVSQERDEWKCFLHGDYVLLRFNPEDFERFKVARARALTDGTADYVMNGVYLPALSWVLSEADKDTEMYAEYRWYGAVEDALSRNGCKSLGDGDSANRLIDAQKILGSPFGRLPFLSSPD